MGKISIQDLAIVLVERKGLTKRDAAIFVSAMFDVAQQALERDLSVKIKGLGTFKIIDVDARESVDVNSGERVLIEGHSKITFTPDAAMKELVNKPFSQFETVVLNDGVEFEEAPVAPEAPQVPKTPQSVVAPAPSPEVTPVASPVVEPVVSASPVAEPVVPPVAAPVAPPPVVERPVVPAPVPEEVEVEDEDIDEPDIDGEVTIGDEEFEPEAAVIDDDEAGDVTSPTYMPLVDFSEPQPVEEVIVPKAVEAASAPVTDEYEEFSDEDIPEWVIEPYVAPAPEPIVSPAPEPVAASPVVEPVIVPPVVEPEVIEIVPQSPTAPVTPQVAEPVVTPVSEPMVTPTPEPVVVSPVVEPVTVPPVVEPEEIEIVPQSQPEPVIPQNPQPVVTQTPKSVVTPEPIITPTPKPVETPTPQPIVEKWEEPVAPVVIEEKPVIIEEKIEKIKPMPTPEEEVRQPVQVHQPVQVEVPQEEPRYVTPNATNPTPLFDDEQEEDDEDYGFEEEQPSSKKWIWAALIALLLGLSIGYVAGNYFPLPANSLPFSKNASTLAESEADDQDDADADEDGQSTEMVPEIPEDIDSEGVSDANEEEGLEAAAPAPAEQPAAALQASATAPASSAANTSASASSAADDLHSKYAAMDSRVRLGAYRIVGTKETVKAREGDNTKTLAKRYLGEGMECYIEVFNGLKGDSQIKAGQDIKIPKLEWKKKSN